MKFCIFVNEFIFYTMENYYCILVGWLSFVAVVYIWAIIDDIYYAHNVKDKLKKVKKAITEE